MPFQLQLPVEWIGAGPDADAAGAPTGASGRGGGGGGGGGQYKAGLPIAAESDVVDPVYEPPTAEQRAEHVRKVRRESCVPVLLCCCCALFAILLYVIIMMRVVIAPGAMTTRIMMIT